MSDQQQDPLDERNTNKEEPLEMNTKQEKMEETKNSEERKSETAASENELENDLDKLQKQLSESEVLIGSYRDQLLRLAAEFENFRKRVEVDKADFVKFSNEKIIKDLLPILDDFERALTNGRKNPDMVSFYKGVELIYQKLSKTLEDKGLEPFDSVGREFDVMYHDVLMQIQRPDAKPHTIVEEVERGYMLHGKVIKHAKVIVAAESKDESDTENKN